MSVENEQETSSSIPFPDMVDMEGVEEIVLGNEFDETASVIIPRRTNHEYTQENKFRGVKLAFKIYNDIYLHQSLESFRKKNVTPTRIDITFLDSEPTRWSHFAWNWFFALVGCYFLGLFLVYLGGFSDYEIAHPLMLPIGLGLFFVGMVSTMVFLYRTQDKYTYHSFVGKVPLITLYNKHRSVDYQRFIETLESHIEQARRRQGLSMLQRLKGELSDLRRLSEEGVISVEDYEVARGLILKHKEYNI